MNILERLRGKKVQPSLDQCDDLIIALAKLGLERMSNGHSGLDHDDDYRVRKQELIREWVLGLQQ